MTNIQEEQKRYRHYREVAEQTPRTKDAEFNRGRKHVLEGCYTSDEAKYFLMCMGLR